MASGLYSQHVNNKKMLYLRNTIIILMLVTLAVCCLFPLFYMIVNSFGPAVLRRCTGSLRYDKDAGKSSCPRHIRNQ